MERLEEKNNLFTSDDIAIICPKMKHWAEMKEVKNGRFCDGCNEKLYYVGGYTKGEVKALQRKYGNNICVGVRKTLVTASLALSLTACSGKISDDKAKIKSIEQHRSMIYNRPVVIGMPVFIELQEKEEISII